MSDAAAPRWPDGGASAGGGEPPTPARACESRRRSTRPADPSPSPASWSSRSATPSTATTPAPAWAGAPPATTRARPRCTRSSAACGRGRSPSAGNCSAAPRRFELVEVGAGSAAFAISMLHALREHHPDCFAAARAGPPRRLPPPGRGAGRPRSQPAGSRRATRCSRTGRRSRERSRASSTPNEFFDALPVHLVGRPAPEGGGGGGSDPGRARRVAREARGSRRLRARARGRRRPPSSRATSPGSACGRPPAAARRPRSPRPPSRAALARRLGRGYLFTLDYGYESAELYAPWRRDGTLTAIRNHAPRQDPLACPGLADLTAHADLGALAGAFSDEGLSGAPAVTQAEALLALGIGEEVADARTRLSADVAGFARLRRSAEVLVGPRRPRTGARARRGARGAPLAPLRCLRPVPGAPP